MVDLSIVMLDSQRVSYWAPAPVQLLQSQPALSILHGPLRPVRSVHVAARHALGCPRLGEVPGWIILTSYHMLHP